MQLALLARPTVSRHAARFVRLQLSCLLEEINWLEFHYGSYCYQTELLRTVVY